MLKLFTRLQTELFLLKEKQDGQTMAEYGVVLGVITLAAIGAFVALGGKIGSAVSAVTAYLP